MDIKGDTMDITTFGRHDPAQLALRAISNRLVERMLTPAAKYYPHVYEEAKSDVALAVFVLWAVSPDADRFRTVLVRLAPLLKGFWADMDRAMREGHLEQVAAWILEEAVSKADAQQITRVEDMVRDAQKGLGPIDRSI
jgi:hypothetical protein